MKVVMLSNCDYAGSGMKFCEAIRKHTDKKITLITKRRNRYDYPVDYCLSDGNLNKIRQLINEADVVHFKGDEPPTTLWNGIIINKPCVVTVGGSNFRGLETKSRIAKARWDLRLYEAAQIKTALTPDLNYKEYNGIYTPQTIESVYQYQKKRVPVICHSPSDRDKKGTDSFIVPVIESLKKNIDLSLN